MNFSGIIVILYTMATVQAITYQFLHEHKDEMHPKIVNGREAGEDEFPWMVALHFRGEYFCSAFLITSSLVMTAAHCVELNNGIEPVSDFFGIIGSIRKDRTLNSSWIDFSRVTTHPDYAATGGADGDIAIFKTTYPVNLSDLVGPICLPRTGRDFKSGKVQAMGWGWTSTNAEKPSDVLTTIPMVLQLKELCRFFYAFFLVSITNRHLCATINTGPGGLCFGDSGGPLVYTDMDSQHLISVGVAAFITAFGCGPPFLPNVYTATGQYVDWIKETAGSESEKLCFQ